MIYQCLKFSKLELNVLIGLSFKDIVDKYKVNRENPLPSSREDPWTSPSGRIDLGTYEREYPKSLFNKGVRANNEDHVGYIMKETPDKIVVFGDRGYRYDIPKSHIIAVGRNVILDIDYPEIFKYEVDRNAPLPTGEAVSQLIHEAYPEDYHGPSEKTLQPKKNLSIQKTRNRNAKCWPSETLLPWTSKFRYIVCQCNKIILCKNADLCL